MSATRDKTQKFAFVYSNLYRIYKEGAKPTAESDAAAPAAPEASAATPILSPISSAPLAAPRQPSQSPGLARPAVLKASDLNAMAASASSLEASPAQGPAPRIHSYNPTSLIGKRVRKPEVLLAAEGQSEAIRGLKDNLKTLNDLHARLRFMLQELEELVRE